MTRQKSVAKAPGRLDFLGGVADYSGSLVLEMPLRLETKVTIEEIAKETVVFASHQEGVFETAFGAKISDLPKWVRYVYGSFSLFCQAKNWRPKTGLRFTIDSSVPLSMGVSSSAALEVSTMRALELFSGKRFVGTALAHLAQRAENEIVGAPCGLMDQLACAYGVQGKLLPILCRPDVLQEPVSLPKGVVAVGWPSGIKHAVSDSPYAAARAGAFMGKAIVNKVCHRALRHSAELRPGELHALSRQQLPDSMSGDEFLSRFGGVDDALTVIERARRYPVRAAIAFPVEENFRCEAAVALLRSANRSSRASVLGIVGELLYQSHAGYTAIGLDSPETDLMVNEVRSLGQKKGFFGARVSGGGSGGTVVVLLEESSLPTLARLAARLKLPSPKARFLR